MNYIFSSLQYIFAFVFGLGLLVAIHEFGHYLAARACGVKVLRFSIGFGKVLWQKKYGKDQTVWALSLVPLGGYVKMLDEREGVVELSELKRSFNQQSVLRQSLIVIAGPVMNLILAALIYSCGFIYGQKELLPVVATPAKDTPAYAAGLVGGELVTHLDDIAITSWRDFSWQLLQKSNDQSSVTLAVVDDFTQYQAGNTADRQVQLDLSAVAIDRWQKSPLSVLGLRPYRPPLLPIIDQVVLDSPAAQAGLKAGDRIVKINDLAVNEWGDISKIIGKSPNQPVNFLLQRQRQNLEVVITPQYNDKLQQAVIGISPQLPDRAIFERQQIVVSYPFFSAIGEGIQQTWQQSIFTVVMLGRMITGAVSLKNISGPVTIADYAGKTFSYGIAEYLQFLALISLSLGVLNLLPIPMLDGGHLFFYAAQFISRNRIPAKWFEHWQRFGIVLLLLMMSVALFNDFNRLMAN